MFYKSMSLSAHGKDVLARGYGKTYYLFYGLWPVACVFVILLKKYLLK